MLDKVWILPALMAGAFVIILFFGKKLPYRGAEVGTAAVTTSLVLSIISVIQWVQRGPGVDEKHGGTKAGDHGAEVGEHVAEAGEHALGVLGGVGRYVMRFAEEGGHHAALRDPVTAGVSWYRDGNTNVELGIHIDGYAVAMLFVVAFISTCVHIFSIEYLKEDKRFTHYFASLALFTGAMFWMVQSSTTLGLLFGWELMGLCSFLLIGHWWEDKANTNAALKAFFTTRTGDIGLLVGIIILFFAAGQTFDMSVINQKALDGEISHGLLLTAAVCLFAGVVGKSAQFPLHTWLPDAMAGPTPASSLIHAATMVVAGVYLVGRLYGVFWMGFSIQAGGMNLGAWVGSITLLMAAALAFVQTDIKKVLAYSTVSQLGYMVMGLSVGAWTGAIFHLFTHAFFKALLFQASGSIAHSGSHHSFEMERMGGLRKYMPRTWATFMVGYLALAGLFPFSGFWSKDEILLGAWKNGFGPALVAGLIGSFMTACYMTRAYWKTFEGENRLHLFHDEHDAHGHDDHDAHGAAAHDDHGHAVHAAHDTAHDTAHVGHAVAAAVAHDDHGGHDDAHDAHGAHGAHDGPHESNLLITGPLMALAVMAAIAGFVNLPKKLGGGFWFGYWTENDVVKVTVVDNGFEHPFHFGLAIVASLFGIAGLLVGLVYNRNFGGDLGIVRRNKFARAIHTLLKNKYYLDVLWTDIVVGSIKGPLARTAYWFNQSILDGVVNSAGQSATATGRFIYKYIDQGTIDGVVNGSGRTASTGGGILRLLQNGRVQSYAALVLGSTGLIGLALVLFT